VGIGFMIGVLSAVTVPLIRARQNAVKMVLNCILAVRRVISKDGSLLIVKWK
jgi:hypothetical protein